MFFPEEAIAVEEVGDFDMSTIEFERILGGVCAPEGFLASGVSCGIKEQGVLDLALVYSESQATVAGLFTSNEVKAAPVVLSRKIVDTGNARAVVINSGNANAITGARGMEDALSMARKVESCLDLPPGQALVASTGVIGEYLPMERVLRGIEKASKDLSPGGNSDAAKAIMTTDTYPKELAVEMEIGGKVIRLGGMAKGAGMIHPQLATMIVVITTDMPMLPSGMKEWLARAVEWSFNRISVDGDQSTNDTILMLSNGYAFPDGYQMTADEEESLFKALCWLTANLSMALVKDGEGATRLLRIVVNGADSDGDAVKVARNIANSHLVKCAFYGGVPNWGRIAMAAGNAGVRVESERLTILLGEHEVMREGQPVDYEVGRLLGILKRDEVEITVELGVGDGSAYFLTSDISLENVRINAERKT